MLIKLMLRSHSFPFSFAHISPPRHFHNLSFFPSSIHLNFSAISTTASFAATSTTTAAVAASINLSSPLDQSFPYGPSLRKGYKLSQLPISPNLQENSSCYSEGDEGNDAILFDEDWFTRVFDISALRVPSEHCFALESRLRGHLLNWPRIRNIARVPGDEVEEEFENLLPRRTKSSSNDGADDFESESLVSLNRRIYGKAEGDGEPLSPVLYRDMLAKTFNSRGYVNFRNLAKMSRPKRRKKNEEMGKGEKKRIGKSQMAAVEVLEEEREEDEEGDFSGLLGIEFKGKKWRGSTRLLLLDERYANKEVNELPEAIKVDI